MIAGPRLPLQINSSTAQYHDTPASTAGVLCDCCTLKLPFLGSTVLKFCYTGVTSIPLISSSWTVHSLWNDR